MSQSLKTVGGCTCLIPKLFVKSQETCLSTNIHDQCVLQLLLGLCVLFVWEYTCMYYVLHVFGCMHAMACTWSEYKFVELVLSSTFICSRVGTQVARFV